MSKKILIELGDGDRNGRMIGRMATGAAGGSERQPMIVALHGGGFTSASLDRDGFSLVSRHVAVACPVFGTAPPGVGQRTRLPHGDRSIPGTPHLGRPTRRARMCP